MTPRELQTLRNLGNEAEAAAEELDALHNNLHITQTALTLAQAECERLRVALQSLLKYDSYQSEYDGQMLTLCPDCGEQDRDHSKTCDFVTARAALTGDAT